MPFYMLQVTYTPDAWTLLLRNPESREGAVSPIIEKLGGRVVGSWLTLGEYHAMAICEMPDSVGVAAFWMAVTAGGAARQLQVTTLMTHDEAFKAMKAASGLGYKAPGG